MLKAMSLFLLTVLIGSVCFAGDVWVNGYTRSDGTYVSGHYRSSPNAYNWDNKSYTPSQPAVNKSYYDTNRSSSWYEPSSTRYQDNNKYNDNPPSYYNPPKVKRSYNGYGYGNE